NGARVEEASAVIELDLPSRRQPRECEAYLLWNGSRRKAFGKCVPPQVAHQAAPWALPIREKDGCNRDQFSGSGALALNMECVRLPWVQLVAFRPLTK